MSTRNLAIMFTALLLAFPEAHDIEVKGAGLEEAFLALTGDETEQEAS